jgi:CRP-like cAMP-binding protein
MSHRQISRHLRPDRVRHLPFFRGFTPQEMDRLLDVGTVQVYAGGEFVATEGTRKQRRVLYVVLQGELHYVKRIRAQHVNVVLRLRPGDVGGFLTFLNEESSPVSVRSLGRTTVFEVGRRELQALVTEHPSLATKLLLVLLGEMARRLDALLAQVADTSAWALDLERHLRALPLLPRGTDAE